MKNKVMAIPSGYSSITPYLIVNNAAKAIEFYKKAFHAIEVLRFNAPNQKIGHAELTIGDSKIMLADEFPEMNAHAPTANSASPVSLHLYVEDVDSVVARAVAAGATLTRPVENKFYGDRSGLLIDPFGHIWAVSTHVEDVSEDELQKRASTQGMNLKEVVTPK